MLQAYEAGRSVPGGNVLEALARMGFNVNWLLTGLGSKRVVTAGDVYSEKMREIRGDLNIPQFVKKLGFSDPDNAIETIQAIENEKLDPDIDLLSFFSNELGINLNWVLGWHDEPMKRGERGNYGGDSEPWGNCQLELDLHSAVIQAIIELLSDVDEFTAKLYSWLAIDAQNIIAEKRTDIPPIKDIKSLIKLLVASRELSENNHQEWVNTTFSRFNKTIDKVVTRGKAEEKPVLAEEAKEVLNKLSLDEEK